MATRSFGWSGFGLRFLFAAVLVLATYNPEHWSYIHWALLDISSFTPFKALLGMVLLVGWVVYLRATLRSLGPIGLGLAVAVFACFAWLLIDMNWINAQSVRAVSYLVMFIVASVMAIGISWSHVRRRITGQVDADDVDA
ncbi:MAG: DUF6524 family protein [Oceanococcus sp.]